MVLEIKVQHVKCKSISFIDDLEQLSLKMNSNYVKKKKSSQHCPFPKHLHSNMVILLSLLLVYRLKRKLTLNVIS